MDELLRQIGDFFLGSIPTMVLFLILLACYTALVHRPLKKVLDERRERTAGAVEKAHAALSVAEAKAQEYEARLRAARVEIQQGRERQVAAWNATREQAMTEAREAASARVRTARAALERDAAASRASLDSSIDQLAAEILHSVLPPAARDEAAAVQGAQS